MLAVTAKTKGLANFLKIVLVMTLATKIGMGWVAAIKVATALPILIGHVVVVIVVPMVSLVIAEEEAIGIHINQAIQITATIQTLVVTLVIAQIAMEAVILIVHLYPNPMGLQSVAA
jgi:hypothetical protein